MKKVAVVILNWNGKHLLEKFLPSIVEFTNKSIADIVVADNASSDESVSFVREYYPELQVIALSENYGYAEGYNKAIEQIHTPYTVLLNSDVEVTPNWLEPLVELLDSNVQIAAVQPKILAQKNKSYFEYAGAAGGFIDKYGYPFCRGRIFNCVEKDSNQYNEAIEVFWASGACLVIRTDAYKAIGGLDSVFFAHMEEIDLCWRLNARGMQIWCLPQSTVYHVGGGTLNEESPKKTFLNFRNNLLMLYKNLPDKPFKQIYKVRFCLDYVAALQMMLNGKFKNAKAIHNAHSEFRQMSKSFDRKRKENLEAQTRHPIPTIYPKSIIWRFYIDGIKNYTKIE